MAGMESARGDVPSGAVGAAADAVRRFRRFWWWRPEAVGPGDVAAVVRSLRESGGTEEAEAADRIEALMGAPTGEP